MSHLVEGEPGSRHLLMGNEAIARGALEAGVSVAAGYPGTPSSEIIENLARAAEARNLYVEWSTNEKIALEVAAAASFAGLRGLAVMKQNGVNVASDFLLHLAGSGTRGGMVLIPCDDPGALSSINEGESRHFARLVEIPLLEPGDFQEAKDMVKWAFELSEELQSLVMLRSVTRLSHASGDVTFGDLPEATAGSRLQVRRVHPGPERGRGHQRSGGLQARPAARKAQEGGSAVRRVPLQHLHRAGEARAARDHELGLQPLQQGGDQDPRCRGQGGALEARNDLADSAETRGQAPGPDGEDPDRGGGGLLPGGPGQDPRGRAWPADRDEDLLRQAGRQPPDRWES